MSRLSRYHDRMSFEDIASAWAAELADQPNAPSASEILGELLSAFLRGEFGIGEQSRVTMPVGSTLIEIEEQGQIFWTAVFPTEHQMVTRDDIREGIRQSKQWRGSPVVKASFEELAEIPIESFMSSGLAEAIKLFHIKFKDFDDLRKRIRRPTPAFWQGPASSHDREQQRRESRKRDRAIQNKANEIWQENKNYLKQDVAKAIASLNLFLDSRASDPTPLSADRITRIIRKPQTVRKHQKAKGDIH